MITNYIEAHKHLEERLIQFGKEMPGPMTGFARLHKKGYGRWDAESQGEGDDGSSD